MALISGFSELSSASDTFSDWLLKTNELIVLMRGGPGVDNVLTANSSGASSFGDVVLTGQMTQNVATIIDELRGGDYTTSDTLIVTSNVELTNAAAVLTVYKDLDVHTTANTRADMRVSANTGDARFYGSTYVEQFFEVGSQVTTGIRNTTVDSLKIEGANIEFNTYTSNSVARIVTNADGNLTIDADVGANGTADSEMALRVDNKDSVTITSGNVDFYDATGASVQARWEGAHDTNAGGLGIRKTAPEANTALDVDGETRVDQLTVDGSTTSNVYVGNTNYNDSSLGHSHWVNLRKADASVSGLGWWTTLADSTFFLDTVVKTTGDESLVLSVDDTARGITTADIDLQSAGVRRMTVYANGDVAFTNNGTDRLIWDDSRGTQGYLRHLDNVRTTYGDGDDFNIFHNGTHTFLVDTGTGNTYLQTSTNFILQDATGAANSIVANTVGEVTLYHNNTEKLQTNATGIEVYGEANTDTLRVNGNVHIDGSTDGLTPTLDANNIQWDALSNTMNFDDDTYLEFGTGGDFKIHHDGSHTYMQDTAGVGNVYLDTNTFIVRNAAGNENMIRALQDTSVALYYNNGIKLETTNIGVDIEGEANTDTLRVQAGAQFESDALTANEDALTWTASTRIFNWNDNAKATFGTDGDLEIYFDPTGNNSFISEQGTGSLYIEGTDLVLRARDDSRYLVGDDGVATHIYSPVADSIELTANDSGIHVTNLANTDTFRSRSTAEFEGNINIQGSTSADTVTWTKSSNTLNFDDNNKVTFGTGGDLEIFHDGSNSFIKDVATGQLNIDGSVVAIRDVSDGTTIAKFTDGAGADISYNGTVRLQTDAGGITVTGNTVADGFVAGDNERLQLGNAQDLELYHDATNSLITNKTGAIIIRNTDDDNDVVIQTDDGAGSITDYIRADGSTTGTLLYSAGAEKLRTTNTGVWIEGEANTDTLRVQSTSDLEGDINIQGSTNADTLTWDKSANTLNFDDNNFATFGTSADLEIYHNGTSSFIKNNIGELIIDQNQNDTDIVMRSDDSTGGLTEYVRLDGSTGEVLLKHYGSTKLATKSVGVTVTGRVDADGVRVGDGELIQLGDAQEFQIVHTAAGDSTISESGAGSLILQANNLVLEDTAGNDYINMAAGGSTSISYAGAVKITTTNIGVDLEGQANTDTLRVQSDAAFDGTAVDAITWDASADTMNHNDNVTSTWGTGGDLAIYHDGASSFIKDQGVGALRICSNDVLFKDEANTETMARFLSDGAATLYFDNSIKFVTQTGGVTVTGNVVSDGFVAGDNEKVQLGAAQDFELYHDAVNSRIDNATGNIVIKNNANDGDVLIATDDSAGGVADYIRADGSTGEVILSHYGSTKFATKATGATLTGTLVADGVTVGDDEIIQLGSTLTLQANTSEAKIVESTTGSLLVQANNIVLESTAGENYFLGTADGASQIYYNGASKLQTLNTGVNVTGNVVSDGLNVDGNAYVSTNTHLGGTSDATHKLQVTGDAKISTTLEVTSNISTNGNVLPLTEFNDLGSATARWDAFLGSVEIGDTLDILPEVDQTSDIGSLTKRFNVFAWNTTVSNDLTVGQDVTIGNTLGVTGVSTFTGNVSMQDSLTVTDDSEFQSNVIFTNIRVDGIANVNTLELVDLQANNFAILGRETDVNSSSATTIATFPLAQSRGLKYIVQGTNGAAASAFAIEIMCVHNDSDVFFTRYGEVSNSFDATITPSISGTDLILQATCPSAAAGNVHNFNIMLMQTR